MEIIMITSYKLQANEIVETEPSSKKSFALVLVLVSLLRDDGDALQFCSLI